MSFKQEFIAHPVGQGLFYSAKISWNSQIKFRMVFDCGSVTAGAGQQEVEIYRDQEFIESAVLDLLIISHFDEDHVCHIHRLLQGGVKVSKIVMPIVSFSERLFLIVNKISRKRKFTSEDEFFISFMIDPLAAIRENLDEDSEIFIIYKGPDEPLSGRKEDSLEEERFDEINDKRFIFDFENKEPFEDYLVTSDTGLKVYKVQDSEKGSVTPQDGIALMEFLFYRRSVGIEEQQFYEKVSELFHEKFEIKSTYGNPGYFEELTNEIKNIDSATTIRDIFDSAIKETGFKKAGSIDLLDMNTTALSLLHRNLNGILQHLGYREDTYARNWQDSIDYYASKVVRIQKFISKDDSRIETQMDFDPYQYFSYRRHYRGFVYPNVLLTSDSFLLSPIEVQQFVNHYKNYWDDYWLFQIPHHGSKSNSNGILHSMIPEAACNFINYGAANKFKHPSSDVVNSLVATGNSVNLISINEYLGMRFVLILEPFRVL